MTSLIYNTRALSNSHPGTYRSIVDEHRYAVSRYVECTSIESRSRSSTQHDSGGLRAECLAHRHKRDLQNTRMATMFLLNCIFYHWQSVSNALVACKQGSLFVIAETCLSTSLLGDFTAPNEPTGVINPRLSTISPYCLDKFMTLSRGQW